MTQDDFVYYCLEYNIDPAIAIESDEVIEVLKNGGDHGELREVLETCFQR